MSRARAKPYILNLSPDQLVLTPTESTLSFIEIKSDQLTDSNVIGKGNFGIAVEYRVVDASLLAQLRALSLIAKDDDHIVLKQLHNPNNAIIKRAFIIEGMHGEKIRVAYCNKHCNDKPRFVSLSSSGKLDGVDVIVCRRETKGNALKYFVDLNASGVFVDRGSILVDMMRNLFRNIIFLHANGLIHRDIAARNVLVGEDGAVLGDLGLSLLINHINDRVYFGGAIPINWTDGETLRTQHASANCDFYGYKVMLIELFAAAAGMASTEHMSKSIMSTLNKKTQFQDACRQPNAVSLNKMVKVLEDFLTQHKDDLPCKQVQVLLEHSVQVIFADDPQSSINDTSTKNILPSDRQQAIATALDAAIDRYYQIPVDERTFDSQENSTQRDNKGNDSTQIIFKAIGANEKTYGIAEPTPLQEPINLSKNEAQKTETNHASLNQKSNMDFVYMSPVLKKN